MIRPIMASPPPTRTGAGPGVTGQVVASQWRDIARYIKIQQMSRGSPDRPSDSPVKGQ
jgi:hypothetical protein